MSKKFAGFAAALVLVASLALPSLASAATLTTSQISAVVALLEAFNVSASTIADVKKALGDTSTVVGSCSEFADLKYGNFDAAPGGRISQLQDWLGISSTAFGYGTYGPKTLSAWNAQCVGTLRPTPTATIDTSSLAASTGGKSAAAVTISGSAANTNQIAIVIKGQSTVFASVVSGRWSGTVANVYPNTYTVQILNEDTNGSKEETLASGTLKVTSDTAKAPTCTLDVTTSDGITKTGLTGTGYYDGSGSTYVEIHTGGWVKVKWHSTNADYAKGPGGDKDLANSSDTYYPGGDKAYEWIFYGGGGQTTCGVMVEIIPAKAASATIDSSSLWVTSCYKDFTLVTITGTAKNTDKIGVSVANGDKEYGSGLVSVVNGLWSVTTTGLPQGSHTVSVYDANNNLLTSGTLSLCPN